MVASPIYKNHYSLQSGRCVEDPTFNLTAYPTRVTDALSEALAPMCKRRRRHDPGKVISDLAVTIAGGGDALA